MAWAGLGVAWIFQEAPSHDSASAAQTPEELKCQPTAVQALAEMHDTLKKYPFGTSGSAASSSPQPEEAPAGPVLLTLGTEPTAACAVAGQDDPAATSTPATAQQTVRYLRPWRVAFTGQLRPSRVRRAYRRGQGPEKGVRPIVERYG